MSSEGTTPEKHRYVRGMLAELASTPGGVATGQFRIRHTDGSWRYLEAVATNLLAEPSVNGIVVNARDITERTLLRDKGAYFNSTSAGAIVGNRSSGPRRMWGSLTSSVRQPRWINLPVNGASPVIFPMSRYSSAW